MEDEVEEMQLLHKFAAKRRGGKGVRECSQATLGEKVWLRKISIYTFSKSGAFL